jgi:hypothetical protein
MATAFSEVSAWVGLGDSTGIEQIGTDTSCDTGKHKAALGSAWWELYPSPSHVVDHPVAVGDRMQASVTVTGHRRHAGPGGRHRTLVVRPANEAQIRR